MEEKLRLREQVMLSTDDDTDMFVESLLTLHIPEPKKIDIYCGKNGLDYYNYLFHRMVNPESLTPESGC